VASIKRQVRDDVVRPIRHKQMVEWLASVWQDANRKRNARIDSELAENPKKYWEKPRKITEWVKEDKVVELPHEVLIVQDGEKQIERDATDEELSYYAPKLEQRDRTFWSYTQDVYDQKQWSPDTMRKVFIEEAGKEECISLPPEWRKLTDEEQKRINELTITKINEARELAKRRGRW
jgi:hypothetical protein